MSIFFRLIGSENKEQSLLALVNSVRMARPARDIYDTNARTFRQIPGAPIAYWVCPSVLNSFKKFSKFRNKNRFASIGASTKDDFRFARLWFEVNGSRLGTSREESSHQPWAPFAKGGAFSPFYSDVPLVINWLGDGRELKQFISNYRGSRGWGYQWSAALNGHDYYYREGLTWPRRTQEFGPRVLPRGCIFADKGPAAFVSDNDSESLLALLALMLSKPFFEIIATRLNAQDATARSFEIGIIHDSPVPELDDKTLQNLAGAAREAWRVLREASTSDETSRSYELPRVLATRHSQTEERDGNSTKLRTLREEIDRVCFELYGFEKSDRGAVLDDRTDVLENCSHEKGQIESPNRLPGDFSAPDLSLLSWCVGVAFGRFDWRMATGEREMPPKLEPFDPLPAKSPGMLREDDAEFHQHAGILADDPGDSHDLARLIESVLERVDVQAASDVRGWLQRDFFKEHLSQYSKSRRKAPIYWPLSTSLGNYTLWIYYPALTSQTLYTAVNDFLEPKLKQVMDNTHALRSKTDRSTNEEKEFEQLQGLEMELKELREMILGVAKDYEPNHDDGVQITAAPLWPLFQHKPWQKVLKDTWKKLEKGDYDWAHLAMNYWPDRVREKCKADKSLAIAHGLEDLYAETPEN